MSELLFPSYNQQYPKDLLQDAWFNLSAVNERLSATRRELTGLSLGSNMGFCTKTYGSSDGLCWDLRGRASQFSINSTPNSIGKQYQILVEDAGIGTDGLSAFLVTRYGGGDSTTDNAAGLFRLNDIYVFHSASRLARDARILDHISE